MIEAVHGEDDLIRSNGIEAHFPFRAGESVAPTIRKSSYRTEVVIMCATQFLIARKDHLLICLADPSRICAARWQSKFGKAHLLQAP